ncbi:MAG: hypothetical protein AAF467_23790 [Actinomycetota bacterium]
MNTEARPVPTWFDPFLGDSGLRQCYHLLHQGAWAEFDAALDGAPDSWLHPFLLLSEDASIETVVFERYADARPSPRSLTYLGGARIRDGYERLATLGRDATVSDRQAFEQQLTAAEALLVDASREKLTAADPWILLLFSGRGLKLDLDTLRDRFENAHSRSPFRADACFHYLLGLGSRSGGSDVAMFDFARWVADEDEPSSPAMFCLPVAHLERGLGPETPHSLTEYLAEPEPVEELTAGLRDYLWETQSEATSPDLLTLNAYALAVTVVDVESARLVRECFRRIDNRPTAYPWIIDEDNNVATVFADIQRAQLRAASRFDF